MRRLERSAAFKRDYKREHKGRHWATLGGNLKVVLVELATEQPLDDRHRDHDPSGNWGGYRECHLRPDLLLIYRKVGASILRLARLGSHNQLLG